MTEGAEMPELKPCPKMGCGKASISSDGTGFSGVETCRHTNGWSVWCGTCGYGFLGRFKTEAEAINDWNLRAPVSDAWQDIETAPLDGSLFLAYVSDEDGSFMMTAYCMDDGYVIPIAGDGNFEPTHWLPLPPAPKSIKGDA